MSRKCRAFSESKLGREPADNRKAFYAGWEAALAEPVAPVGAASTDAGVPVEPTPVMAAAGAGELPMLDGRITWLLRQWQAMLAAAPTPPQRPAEPEGGGNLPPPLQEPTVAETATTQRPFEETPPSEYRRGYWDGFAIGKREGRIEAEDALAGPSRAQQMRDAGYTRRPTLREMAEPAQEPQCNPHPEAPHGFLRNASHTEGRYVCTCEYWTEPAQEHGIGGEA